MTKTPFDHLSEIYVGKSIDYFQTLSEADRKTFSPYMINRFISMNVEYLPLVNMFQKYLNIASAEDSYKFYSQALPHKRANAKYIKAEKSTGYEDWLIELVAQYYTVSQKTASEYLDEYYKDATGKAALRELCEYFGIEPKQIKKVKI